MSEYRSSRFGVQFEPNLMLHHEPLDHFTVINYIYIILSLQIASGNLTHKELAIPLTIPHPKARWRHVKKPTAQSGRRASTAPLQELRGRLPLGDQTAPGSGFGSLQ